MNTKEAIEKIIKRYKVWEVWELNEIGQKVVKKEKDEVIELLQRGEKYKEIWRRIDHYRLLPTPLIEDFNKKYFPKENKKSG